MQSGILPTLTAQFYTPADIIMVDRDDNRLEVAKRSGTTPTVNSASEAVEAITRLVGTVSTRMPLNIVRSNQIDPTSLITHHFTPARFTTPTKLSATPPTPGR
jgi:threonine dehydrogenase-like Zn-dependent dehydrogenase